MRTWTRRGDGHINSIGSLPATTPPRVTDNQLGVKNRRALGVNGFREIGIVLGLDHSLNSRR